MSATQPYTPTPVVELAFVGRNSVTGPGMTLWHDISGDCFSAKTFMGRQSEFDNFSVGTLSVGLYNDDRKYDPTYAGSLNPGFEDGNATIKLLAEFDEAITLYSDTFTTSKASFWENLRGTDSISSGKLTGNDFTIASPMFDASRAKVTVEVPTAAGGVGSTFFALAAGVEDAHTDGELYARVRITNGTIYYQTVAPGDLKQTSDTYNSTNHRWLQIEFTDTDEIVYRTSADGATWSVAATHDHAGATYIFESLPTHLRAVLEEAYATGSHAEFDNFSIETTRLPVWYGYVDSFRLEYEEGGKGSTCTLTAVDRLSYLADYNFGNTFREYLSDVFGSDLDDYYPMDRVSQATPNSPKEVENQGFNKTDNFRALVEITEADGLCRVSNGALLVPKLRPEDGRKGVPLQLTLPPDRDAAQGTSFAVGMWIRFPDAGNWGTAGTWDHWLSSSTPDANLAFMALNGGITAGNLGAFLIDFEGDQLDTQEAGYLYDGRAHHIMFSRNGAELIVYFDGETLVNAYNASCTSNSYSYLEFLAIGPVGNGSRETPEVVLDEVMIWRGYAPTNSQVADLYREMTEGYLLPTNSGATINTLLNTIGWSPDARAVDSGEVVVSLPGNLEGMNALETLNVIAQTENGRLFCDPLGRLVFHDRGRFLRETTEATSQYSFTDTDRDTSPSDVGIIEDSFRVTLDDQFRITRAEVTRDGGYEQISESAAGTRYTKSLDGLLFTNDLSSLNLAQWLTFRYAVSELRADEWQVNPETYTDDWSTILQLGIGTRVDLEVTPGSIGDPMALDMVLGMVKHDINDEEWLVTFHGTPADNNDYFLWDTSESLSDTNGWADTDFDPAGGYWG